PAASSLFPYTTLFRSWTASGVSAADGAAGAGPAGAPADGVPAGGDAASPAGLPPVYVEDRGTETDAETIARFREELAPYGAWTEDRKSTRLNSSHVKI